MPNFDDIDLTNVIMDGDPYGEFEDPGGGGDEGHTYDLEMSSDKAKVTLTEDGVDKTTLPLVATFVGTRAEWNALSAAEQAQYRILHFTDEQASVFSHVGQIIESTTLDTEVKVKAIYGSNTSWIQHIGYMLRGASSGVVSGSQGQNNDGGADSVTVSSVASHNHTQNSHNHTQNAHSHKFSSTTATVGANTSVDTEHGSIANSNYGPNSGGAWTMWSLGTNVENATATNQAKTATNQANGANYTVNTIPKYKNVYIWERVS